MNVVHIRETLKDFHILQTTARLQTAIMYLRSGEASGNEMEAHPDSDQMIVMLEGELFAEVGDGRQTIGNGQMLMIPAGTPHRLRNHGDVSLDADDFDFKAPVTEDDQRAFDRGWAVRMLELAFERVRADCGRDPQRFEILREFLPGSTRQPTSVDAAQRMGVNENTLHSEVHRLRGRFRDCLRAEVALTTSAPHEVDAEIAWLREVLTAAGRPTA